MRGYKNYLDIQPLENKLQDKFVDPLIRLCSFSLKTETTLGFIHWQSYTTLRRILMTELEIINDVIFSYSENICFTLYYTVTRNITR